MLSTAPENANQTALQDQIQALIAERNALQAENTRLQGLLMTDELTGLDNRRGFEAAFLTEQDRFKRGLSAGGLMIMIDLDRFKTINDTLGHAAGDQALKVVANALRSQTRAMDTPARLSGDEFAVLLVGVAAGTAISRAQHLSLTLNKLSFDWHGQIVRIGASLGVRALNTHDTCATLLAKADALMYANKQRSVPAKPFTRGITTDRVRLGTEEEALVAGLLSLGVLARLGPDYATSIPKP